MFCVFAACAPAHAWVSAIFGGTAEGQFRDYFMDRNYYSNPAVINQSNAIGGYAGYRSPAWRGIRLGLGGYTSQKFFLSPEEWDGASLLAPGQKGFSVLGQSYLEYSGGGADIVLFRQMIDTPFINAHDAKMVPVTYEAYTANKSFAPGLKVTLSQITGIKTWTATNFVSMSQAAGFDNTDYQVTMAGAVFTPAPGYKFQFWNYQAWDFMNTTYFQGDIGGSAGGWKTTLSAQALAQVDTGGAIGGRIRAAETGIRFGMSRGGFDWAAGYTQAARSHDIVNPWGGYPGYTSIMEEDCDMSGERSWLLHLGYDFTGIGLNGFYSYIDMTRAYIHSGDITSPQQREGNLVLKYNCGGKWEGLSFTAKAAAVTHSHSMGGIQYDEFRFIAAYNF